MKNHYQGKSNQILIVFFLSYVFTSVGILTAFRFMMHSYIIKAGIYYALISIFLILAYEVGGIRDKSTSALRTAHSIGYFLGSIAASICLSVLNLGININLIFISTLLAITINYYIKHQKWILSKGFLACGLGIFTAAIYFLLISGAGNASVLAPEKFLTGSIHSDTLYLSSIASMFSKFGVPSTGLDGIPITYYHTLSNLFLGALARGAEVNIATGYFLGVHIVLMPMLLFSLFKSVNSIIPPQTNWLISIIIIPLAILHFISLRDWNSYLVSESYALSLTFFMFGIIYLHEISQNSKGSINTQSIIICCILCIAMISAKVSVGGIFIAGMFFTILRNKNYSYKNLAVLLIFLPVTWLILSGLILPAAHVSETKLQPLHFFQTYRLVSNFNFFIILCGASLCFLGLKRNQELVWNQLILFMLLVSIIPALILKIEGGSAYYFLNIGTWLSIVVISKYLILLNYKKQHKIIKNNLSLLFFAPIFLMLANAYHSKSYSLLNADIANLKSIIAPHEITSSMIDKLNKIGEGTPRLPLEILSNKILKLKESNNDMLIAYTDSMWQQIPYGCTRAPFFAPAYLKTPMLMGLRSTNQPCEYGPWYSFPEYDQQLPSIDSQSKLELCAAVRQRRFKSLAVVKSPDQIEIIECKGAL
jgi:hypothetical protein